MATDDHARITSVKFLHNQRTVLAGSHMESADLYSRRLSQYGENALDPALRSTWTLAGDES